MLDKLHKIIDFLTSRTMNIFDYIGAFAVLFYGLYLYTNNQAYILVVSIGVLALILAIIKPAKLIKDKMKL